MMKSDKSKHHLCIASIKRSATKPYDFKLARFYESNAEFYDSTLRLDLLENELIICSTIIDSNNYSVLTTQRLFTKENEIETIGNLSGATDKLYGDFKGYENVPYTLGLIQLSNGTSLKYFIETGKASMVMIYGVRTLIMIQ